MQKDSAYVLDLSLLRRMKLVDPILLPAPLFRHSSSGRSQSICGSWVKEVLQTHPGVQHWKQVMQTPMVERYRHPCVWGARLVRPSQISMGKHMAQLGTRRELFSCWENLARAVGLLGPLYGMGVFLFLELLINYLIALQNKGADPSAWSDLTSSALLLKGVRSWRRGTVPFPSMGHGCWFKMAF